MTTEAPRTGERRAARARNLVFVAIIAAAAVGYFVGLGGGTPRPDGTGTSLRSTAVAPSERTAPPAMSYEDLATAKSTAAPEAPWRERVASLRATLPAAPITDEASKLASLAQRSERRAFNGAPPVIPHAVDGVSDAACNVCHVNGLAPGPALAKRPPHPSYAQCTQCHAPPAPAMFADATPVALSGALLARNSFVGAPAPTQGDRAWPGAPPVMPHSSWMRNECASCHGPSGWPGMQTSHPERLNCLQCHAQGAQLEQFPAAGMTPAFLPAPVVRAP